jgi:hypothetical protein
MVRVPDPSAEAVPIETVPLPLPRTTPPVKVFAPVSAKIPVPVFVTEPLPVIAELTDKLFPVTSTTSPVVDKLPPDTTPVPVEESDLPAVSVAVPLNAKVPLFTSRLPESVVFAAMLIEPALSTSLLYTLEADSASVPALVFVSVPPVTVELMVNSEPELTSTPSPAVASDREPPEIVPPPLEVMPPELKIATVPMLNWPPFTARLPESVVLAFVMLIEPALSTSLLYTLEADNARVPALVFVSVPPVTVELMVNSEPELTSTPLPAVASDREPPEIVPPPLEVIPEAASKVSVPFEVTAPPFTARLPESVLVPSERVPAVATAPSVLPFVKIAEAPEAMLSAFVPERAVRKVSEPPLPTDTEPVKALSVPLTERMPLVESAPVPLNSPLNEPPETISEPELLTDPLVRVETWTNALEPTVNLPAVNEPMVLKLLP